MTKEDLIKQNEKWTVGMNESEKKEYWANVDKYIEAMTKDFDINYLDKCDFISIPPRPMIISMDKKGKITQKLAPKK